MKSLTIKLVAALLVLVGTAQADNLGQLRTRLNAYIADESDLMLSSARKDSIINVAQQEYAGMYPVYIDTTTIVLDSGQRIDTLNDDFAGVVLSVHKLNKSFTEVKYIPGDSIPALQEGIIEYYTQRHKMMIFYPPPEGSDSVMLFHTALPSEMDADSVECTILDYLEEPIVLLAASKCYFYADLQADLIQMFYNHYIDEATRLMRLEAERVKP